MSAKCIIFSAPSGAGKTTIVNHLVAIQELNLSFSISACTRKMRDGEQQGRDYHFMLAEEFRLRIDDNEFIEWEEVYKNHYYGTLKSEIKRIWEADKNVVFDVDVMGGINLKRHFGHDALSIFVMPPSVEVLQQRLEARGTEPPDKIKGRISRASFELKYAEKFDLIIVNDNLDIALKEAEAAVQQFVANKG